MSRLQHCVISKYKSHAKRNFHPGARKTNNRRQLKQKCKTTETKGYAKVPVDDTGSLLTYSQVNTTYLCTPWWTCSPMSKIYAIFKSSQPCLHSTHSIRVIPHLPFQTAVIHRHCNWWCHHTNFLINLVPLTISSRKITWSSILQIQNNLPLFLAN
jgi:hypothetical protein